MSINLKPAAVIAATCAIVALDIVLFLVEKF